MGFLKTKQNPTMAPLGILYRVCGLRLGLNFGKRPAAGKNFYLPLTVEKMCVLKVLTKKYLGLCGYNGSNCAAMVNCISPNTEIQSKITETKIKFSMQRFLLISNQLVCLQLIGLVVNYRLLRPL